MHHGRNAGETVVHGACVVEPERAVLEPDVAGLLANRIRVPAGEDRPESTLHRPPNDEMAGVPAGAVDQRAWRSHDRNVRRGVEGTSAKRLLLRETGCDRSRQTHQDCRSRLALTAPREAILWLCRHPSSQRA